jgi:hypothetical protein
MGLQQCCLPLILGETSSRDVEFLQAAPWSSKLIDCVFEWRLYCGKSELVCLISGAGGDSQCCGRLRSCQNL